MAYRTDEGTPLLSAVDGSEVARISSTGVDVAGMIDYARTVGAPALAQLTFHERALALKSLALTLMAGKEEFYTLSAVTGATRKDSAVDIDGGFGTLLSYASKARRELPNDTVYLDGAPNSWASAARSSASTSTPPAAVSPYRSTPSTSRSGVSREAGSRVHRRRALDRQTR